MERLTIKNSDGTHSQVTETKFIQFFDKVAEFEDFIEEQGFKNLEDFKKALEIKLPDERVKQIALEEMRKEIKNHIAQILKKEVPELYRYKDNWQKLKEWLNQKYNEDWNKYIEDKDWSYRYFCEFNNKVLDKMQELEKEMR